MCVRAQLAECGYAYQACVYTRTCACVRVCVCALINRLVRTQEKESSHYCDCHGRLEPVQLINIAGETHAVTKRGSERKSAGASEARGRGFLVLAPVQNERLTLSLP